MLDHQQVMVLDNMVCAERSALVGALAEVYHEHVVVRLGQAESGEILELLSSPDGRTWTLLVQRLALSCVKDSGEDFMLNLREWGEKP